MQTRWQLLSDCAAKFWAPSFGDADMVGFMLLALYALVTAAAVLILIRAPFSPESRFREQVFWSLVAALLALLTVNKQLDLQVFLTATGRCVARAEGWYATRRLFQTEVTFALLIAGGLGLVLMGVLLRGTFRRNALALLGLAGLVTFVDIRLVSFHHFDQMLGISLFNTRLHRLIEGTVLLILLGGEARILLQRPASLPRQT